MPLPAQRLQPRSYSAFRCIGADCEDTCCVGWGVNIDRLTYEAYQLCDDPELSSSLHQLVTINPANGNEDNYAKITLSGPGCPFLTDGLCSIQKKLGEQYLSKMCATYPRVLSMVDDVLNRSLHVSCPEAARIFLLDPNPMQFDEEPYQPDGSRLQNLPVLNTDRQYQYFREIRSLVIWLLQNRTYALPERMIILGSLCDQLGEIVAAGRHHQIPPVLEGYRDATERRLFDGSLRQLRAQPAAQLETVVELIVSRIGSDYTSHRFLECYQEFMHGLEWTPESTMDDIALRYTAAWSQYYAPFMREHEYMLEQYLVNYAHASLFPFGAQDHPIARQYMLMAVYFSVIQTVLIGMSGFHKTGFGSSHVLKLVQSCAKTFEHSVAFPPRALKILSDKGMQKCVSLAVLLHN